MKLERGCEASQLVYEPSQSPPARIWAPGALIRLRRTGSRELSRSLTPEPHQVSTHGNLWA